MRIREKAFTYFGLSLMVFTTMAGLFPQKVAAYDTAGAVVNAATIKLEKFKVAESDKSNIPSGVRTALAASGGTGSIVEKLNAIIADKAIGTYKNGDINDAFYSDDPVLVDGLKFEKKTGNCTSTIKIQNGKFELTDLNLEVGASGCQLVLSSDHTFNIRDTNNMLIWFEYQDSKNLVRVDGRDGGYSENNSNSPNIFYSSHTTGDCKDNVDFNHQNDLIGIGAVNGVSPNYAKANNLDIIGYHRNCPGAKIIDTNGRNVDIDRTNRKLGWNYKFGVVAYVGNKEAKKNPGTASTASDANIAPSCDSVGKGVLNWLFCAVINMVDNSIQGIASGVDKMLDIDVKAITTGQNGDNLHQVWSYFRNIASLLLILIALVMIISQAIDAGPFDAYTIRKVLPRLLAAVILIQLSWFVFTNMIQVVDQVAWGIEGLMYAPFGGKGALDLSSILNNTSLGGGGLFASAVVLGAGAGAVALGTMSVLSLALSAFLFLAVGFFVLVLRQAVVLGLLVLAPIALAAWILPGTDKYWKLWWESFSKLLLMYPMILLLIAAGRIFAIVTTNLGSSAGLAGTATDLSQFVIVIVGFFGPFVLIPKTFTLAGSAFSGLTGMVNNRSKGAFDRLKNGRQKRTQENFAHMKTGDRFQGRNAAAKYFNKRSAGLAGGVKGGFGFGARGEAAHDIHSRHAAEEAIRNNHDLRQLAYDDNGIAVMALSGGTRKGAELAANKLGLTGDDRERAINSAATIGFNGSNAQAALTLMAQNKSRVLTGALAGEAGMDLVRQSATDLAGGNKQLEENLMGGFAFHSRNAGRLDFGGESAGQSLQDGWQRATTAQHAQAFGASTQAFANKFGNDILTGDKGEKAAAAVALSEMQNIMPNASAENQGIINSTLTAVGVDHNLAATEGISVEQQLANIANGYTNRGRLQDAAGNELQGPMPAGPAPVITAAEIQGTARQYGNAVPLGARPDGMPEQPKPTDTEDHN